MFCNKRFSLSKGDVESVVVSMKKKFGAHFIVLVILQVLSLLVEVFPKEKI